MDIPTFLSGSYEENQDYHEQTQQILLQGIGPNGFEISQLTSAQVATITSMNFLPVQPFGKVFAVTDAAAGQQWQGILTPAVYKVSNAVLVYFNYTII
jgi:hypothetical protein